MKIHTSQDLPAVINQAINATMSRTILTSGATLLAVLALLALGGEVIFPFAATMAIGIVVGTYSTVYIASPIMLLLAGRKDVADSKSAAQARKGGKQKKARA
jgi:preprotein translocase subunit SecF